jgi:hypothetical protein
MKEWNYDGERGAINRPTAAQIENIKSVAGGPQLAVIPVAQTALVVIVNPLPGCEFEGVTEFITNAQLASVFEGKTYSWSQLEELETESEKTACEAPITRVVPRTRRAPLTSSRTTSASSTKKGPPVRRRDRKQGHLAGTGVGHQRQSWRSKHSLAGSLRRKSPERGGQAD